MNTDKSKILGKIPSMTAILQNDRSLKLIEKFGDSIVKLQIRQSLDSLRQTILAGKIRKIPSIKELLDKVEKQTTRYTQSIGRKAINATGIMLHTGLGRAPFANDALEALSTFTGYSILQTDLETGKRSLREEKIEKMLIELTGCEAATVVNNNAAATMLILNTLTKGREVIVSRGQLIEIGGSFRLPDVMSASGCELREIGTTNRTHLKDYKAALNENTGAIIHVHTSNYRVRGFSSTPDIKAICEFRQQTDKDLIVIDDLGSGALVSLAEFGLPNEPLVKDSIAAGADVSCFSGDKLICGAQAGIICGNREIIQKIRKNPFSRMFRVDKMTLAVLESTLIHFVNNTYRQKIPFYQMLDTPISELQKRAEKISKSLKKVPHLKVEIIDDFAYIGSGSIPDEGVASKVVKITSSKPDKNPDKMSKTLRNHIPSIFVRIKDGSLLLDMRTLFPNDVKILVSDLPGIL